MMAESSDSDSIPCAQKSAAESPMALEDTAVARLNQLAEQVLRSKLDNASSLDLLSVLISDTYFKTDKFKIVSHFGDKLMSLLDAFDSVSESKPELSDLLKSVFPLYLGGEVFAFYKLLSLDRISNWCCLRRTFRLANIEKGFKRVNRVTTI